MKLKLEIDMGNAAFDGCNGDEAASILRALADRLEGTPLHGGHDGANLRDFNGNKVGSWKVTR